MKRTYLFKTNDSEADPYIEQKDVVLCRSGIQLYHKSELSSFITADNKPPVDKEWYREYRPANVVVKAKDLCRSLPVTKEHPNEWVNPDNWKELAGGTTDKEVEVVALDGESDGEIGLKSNLTFYDRELYDYYSKNNKEVSLGYTCKKHFVDDPEKLGYDIVLDEITEVNHVAVTRSGRGGSSVAVIDSILGGMKPMRTGLFAWLKGKVQKDSAEKPSFGKQVFDSLKASKGVTEEELAQEMKGVLDSCAILKDCKEKSTLIDTVKDCFDNKDKALANEDEISKALDSMYVNVSGDSIKEIADAFGAMNGGCTASQDTAQSEKDSSDKKEEKEEKKEDKGCDDSAEEEEKKEDEKEKAKDSSATDSKPLTAEDVERIVKDSIEPLVAKTVKDVLGLKTMDSKPEVKGSEIDAQDSVIARDYSDFLDN
jgi:Uncharacterized protein conserved in bacteria